MQIGSRIFSGPVFWASLYINCKPQIKASCLIQAASLSATSLINTSSNIVVRTTWRQNCRITVTPHDTSRQEVKIIYVITNSNNINHTVDANWTRWSSLGMSIHRPITLGFTSLSASYWSNNTNNISQVGHRSVGIWASSKVSHYRYVTF